MAAVQIIVPKYDAKTGRPKMVIMGSNNDMFELPWAPQAVSHSPGGGEEVVEIERAGRVPDIAVKNPRLHKMSFSFLLGKDLNKSVEGEITRLENIVNVGGWVMVLYGQKESGLWKVTDFSWESIQREPLQNQVSQANVNMSFTEVPDSRKTVAKYSSDFNFRDDAVSASISQSLVELSRTVRARGNVSSGSGGLNGSTGVTSPGKGAVAIPPHIVQAGETLLSIAQKYYGEYGEQFWRLVGDFNKVAGSLNIGQILRIP